ncbi:MAG: MBOAT family protein [Butyrivibrio sp.]|nr:MBOAT family protein [Butyrivibrio sp.]
MQFNSYIFILCFLPIALLGYFGLHNINKKNAAQWFLLIMSLWFYGYFNPSYLIIICASIVINYVLYRGMDAGKMPKKVLLSLGLIFNIGLIFYFKYYDFFLENINALVKTDFVLRHITLPLGISFFTFQQISFIVDAYRGEVRDYSFLEYALFVSFFPQLVAGPIVLHKELIPEFRNKEKYRPSFDNLSRGLMIFSRGLAKKMLIADMFGGAVDFGINQASVVAVGEGALTRPEIIILMLSYTFQIYFDFSGYSDMATGLGKMFNFDIPMNFNSPYKALSIADFWKRWHMTLTRFLTTYVYIPLGGNRKGKVRTYINTMIVFLVSGIWHGANWTFILWGVLHGIGQCINKLFHNVWRSGCGFLEKSMAGKLLSKLLGAFAWVITFAFLNVTWLLFRADSVTMWLQILKRLTVLNLDIREDMLEPFRIPKFSYLLSALSLPSSDGAALRISCALAMAFALIICLCCKNNYEREYKLNIRNMLFTVALLFMCIISMSSISTFLYFNF